MSKVKNQDTRLVSSYRERVRYFPMADTSKELPEDVVLYILSFLETRNAASTCALSKDWASIWRQVPTFHFRFESSQDDPGSFYVLPRFVEKVNSFFAKRDNNAFFKRFYLSCPVRGAGSNEIMDEIIDNARRWITSAVERELENLELYLSEKFGLPPAMLRCQTLAVLKLKNVSLSLEPFQVDLPCLKILNMTAVEFSKHDSFKELVTGCPGLEELLARTLYFKDGAIEFEGNFTKLMKLKKAIVDKDLLPLKSLTNVQSLDLYLCDDNLLSQFGPEKFENLTNVQVRYGYRRYIKNWLIPLEMLSSCPILQGLTIEVVPILQGFTIDPSCYVKSSAEEKWVCPTSVPKCILSSLKKCHLPCYFGSTGEFLFAKYVLKNAKVLRSMTIKCCEGITEPECEEGHKRFKGCQRISPESKLDFIYPKKSYYASTSKNKM